MKSELLTLGFYSVVGESIESAEVLSAKEPRLPEIPIPNGFPLDPSYTPIDRWEGTERFVSEFVTGFWTKKLRIRLAFVFPR